MAHLSRTVVTVGAASLGVVLSLVSVRAQTRPGYREYALGSSVVKILEQTHAATSDVARVHERPALIQTLQWRLPYFAEGTDEPQKDSVEQIVFSFVDDQLSTMSIDYERRRTEGMTDADMIAAVSGRYGSSSPLIQPRPLASVAPQDSSKAIGWWQDGDAVAVLFRNTFTSAFRLVVTSERLDSLARAATVEAIRLEAAAAPALALARQRQDADAVRAAKEKARTENKAAFRP